MPLSVHFLAILAPRFAPVAPAYVALPPFFRLDQLVFQSGVQGPESQQANQKAKIKRQKAKVPAPQPLTPDLQPEAEACFLKAIEIAHQQQAKTWELRATMSLARLQRQQGKAHEALKMLAAIYNWFTEGFDTKDLQEAKALLEELHH